MTKKRTLLFAAAATGILVFPSAPAMANPPQKAPGAEVYTTHIKDLGSVGNVPVKGSAYGSALTPKPGSQDVFYGLTDRGPNVDGPDGIKIEPYPDYAPQIGEFRMVNGLSLIHI